MCIFDAYGIAVLITCIFLGIMSFLGQKYMYIVLCNLCETSLASAHEFKWQRSCLYMFLTVNVQLNVTQMLQLLFKSKITCIWLLSIFNHDFLSDCPKIMHCIGFHYVQHLSSNVGASKVCELAPWYSFFHRIAFHIEGLKKCFYILKIM